MRIPNVKRPHVFQELAALTNITTHSELYWTKLGIHMHPCKNWFVKWIDIFLSEIERMWLKCILFKMSYLLVLYHSKCLHGFEELGLEVLVLVFTL